MTIFEYVLTNYTRYYDKQVAVWHGLTMEIYTIYEDNHFTQDFLSYICKDTFRCEKELFNSIIIINS